MLTFAYGCGLAGVAGTVISSLKSVAPPMGQDYLVDAWMTVVTGGVDKLIGVLAGAVLIGESFMRKPDSVKTFFEACHD